MYIILEHIAEKQINKVDLLVLHKNQIVQAR